MKKIAYIVTLLIIACGAHAAYAQGQLDFKAETKAVHKAGDKIKMSWTSTDIPTDKTLEIYITSNDKGYLYPIKGELPLKGSYTWKIPKDTASANDYQLMMSTQDKGPSVESNISAPFSINGKAADSVAVKKFTVKATGKKDGSGKITVQTQRKNGTHMQLNIACTAGEVTVRVKGMLEGCNNWIYFNSKSVKTDIEYMNLTEKEVKVYVTLDLYNGSTLVQRIFKDTVVQPGTKVAKANDNVFAISNTDHVLGGNKNAPVTVITYTDLECPFCKKFNQTIQSLYDHYGTNVAFVYRHFPLSEYHVSALPAARAAECVAGLKGDDAFYGFISDLFASQTSGQYDFQTFEDIAQDHGVDSPNFNRCMDSDKFTDMINTQRRDGEKLGVSGTPYSFVVVGGKKKAVIEGAQEYWNVKDVIDSYVK